jgi:hypothetical protein
MPNPHVVISKRIIVIWHEKIPELNNVYGPILTPFWCDVDIIFVMIQTKKRIYEVLDDGTMVLLNQGNYDKDNGGGTPGPIIDPNPPAGYGFNQHLTEQIDSAQGLHREVRYYNGHFEYFDNVAGLWREILTNDEFDDLTPSAITLGGIEKDQVLSGLRIDDVLHKLLHPTVRPTIVLATVPSNVFLEDGTVTTSINLNAQVTKGALSIASVNFVKDTAVINTPVVSNANVANYIYTYNGNINSDTVFKTVVNDGEVNTTATHNITFVEAKFIGTIPATQAITSTVLSLLDKVLDSNNYLVASFNANNERVCFAVPSTNTISSITDQNGFIVTQVFDVTQVAYTKPNSQVINYDIYSSIDPLTVTDFRINFNFE